MTESTTHTGLSQTTGALLAVATTICGALPTFLTSALAVQLQDELEFGPGALGLATSVSFGMGGLASQPMGRMVQVRGSRFGMQCALALSGLSLVLVLSAPSYSFLLIALAVAGLGNAIAQPTANLMITEMVSRHRLGVAMGVKQSYIPIASLLGGLAVPIIAVQLGWRWAMAGAAVLCVVTIVGGRRRTRPRVPGAPPSAPAPATATATTATSEEPTVLREDVPPPSLLGRRALLLLTVAGALSAGSATALGVFLVAAAVDAGVDPGTAGYLLAVCAACSLAGRVTAGWVADRAVGRSLYLACANIMVVSVCGMVLLAAGSGWVFVLGGLLGYIGWCWPGLYHLAVIRDSPGAVASATGTVQAGFSGGAAVGPLVLGLVAEASSYRVAWLVTAVVGAVGIAAVHRARRVIRIDRGLPVRWYAGSGGDHAPTTR